MQVQGCGWLQLGNAMPSKCVCLACKQENAEVKPQCSFKSRGADAARLSREDFSLPSWDVRTGGNFLENVSLGGGENVLLLSGGQIGSRLVLMTKLGRKMSGFCFSFTSSAVTAPLPSPTV